MSVRPGESAPAFTLPSGPGEEVDVGELLGREKVVLLFFPLAYSRVCTTELATFARHRGELRRLDARVFAISVDSPYVTRKFREDEGIPFPVLSDFDRRVAEEYGVLDREHPGGAGVARRSVFVAGEDGRVAYSWIGEGAGVEPPYDEVMEAVRDA